MRPGPRTAPRDPYVGYQGRGGRTGSEELFIRRAAVEERSLLQGVPVDIHYQSNVSHLTEWVDGVGWGAVGMGGKDKEDKEEEEEGMRKKRKELG